MKTAEKGVQIFPTFIYFLKRIWRLDSVGNKQLASAAGTDRSPLSSRQPHYLYKLTLQPASLCFSIVQ